MYKLTSLSNNDYIAQEHFDGIVPEKVSSVRDNIRNHNGSKYEDGEWYVVEKEEWAPNAKTMLEVYINNSFDNLTLENVEWSDSVWREIDDYTIDKLQRLLDEVFNKKSVSERWRLNFEKPVEIDMFPPEEI